MVRDLGTLLYLSGTIQAACATRKEKKQNKGVTTVAVPSNKKPSGEGVPGAVTHGRIRGIQRQSDAPMLFGASDG